MVSIKFIPVVQFLFLSRYDSKNEYPFVSYFDMEYMPSSDSMRDSNGEYIDNNIYDTLLAFRSLDHGAFPYKPFKNDLYGLTTTFGLCYSFESPILTKKKSFKEIEKKYDSFINPEEFFKKIKNGTYKFNIDGYRDGLPYGLTLAFEKKENFEGFPLIEYTKFTHKYDISPTNKEKFDSERIQLEKKYLPELMELVSKYLEEKFREHELLYVNNELRHGRYLAHYFNLKKFEGFVTTLFIKRFYSDGEEIIYSDLHFYDRLNSKKIESELNEKLYYAFSKIIHEITKKRLKYKINSCFMVSIYADPSLDLKIYYEDTYA